MTLKLSDRIQTARKHAGFTQKELADRVGISQTAIHKLECGRSRSSRRTVAISLACGVDPIWLETGRGEIFLSSKVEAELRGETFRVEEEEGGYATGVSRTAKAPLITWDEVSTWRENTEDPNFTSSYKTDTYIPVTKKVSKKVFAVRVTGDSMENEFSEGDIIVVDPMVPYDHKKYVVARSSMDDRVTFKQLIMDGGRRYLKPLNSRYPIIELDGNAEICGVVVSKYKEY